MRRGGPPGRVLPCYFLDLRAEPAELRADQRPEGNAPLMELQARERHLCLTLALSRTSVGGDPLVYSPLPLGLPVDMHESKNFPYGNIVDAVELWKVVHIVG